MSSLAAPPPPAAAAGPLPADLSRWLCAEVAQWRFDDLPPAVVQTLQRFVVDTVGVIAGAAHAPGIAALDARIARWEAGGTATVLLTGARCAPPSAALCNGAAAHALDFDDLHDGARVHTNCIVLPALLAVAEDAGPVPGRDFLLALAVGTELHARLGLACPRLLATGWHPTMVLGALTASLAAGRLLHLDAAELNIALGLAYHQAGGTAQSMHDGVLAKRLGAGFAARAAVLAAYLAQDGLTGPVRTLEGDAGLFALFARGDASATPLVAGLRTSWHIPDYSFKPFPGCRCNHTVIGLGQAAHRDGIAPGSIATIDVRMGAVNVRTVGERYDAARASIVHAQFNAAYSLARALTDGVVTLRSYEAPAIVDPDVAALARKIRVVADPALDADAIAPASITVRLHDGATVSYESRDMPGSPRAPMTDAQFLDKFHGCLADGLGATAAAADALAATILDLEHSTDVARDLVHAFATARRAAHPAGAGPR